MNGEAGNGDGGLSAQRVVLVCLGIAVAASVIWLISLDSRLTFIADDWMLLVKRQGWGASYFLEPFHGSNIVGLAVVFKLLREVFGIGSATPYYVASILTFAGSAVLLFVYLKRRVGEWPALFAAVLILFLGAAFEDLLFAFQIGYFGSVAAGLGMLIALDREDDVGDRFACALLVLSLSLASVGLAFAAAALVDLAFGRRPRGRRVYVALLPIALYGLWWLGWGHDASSHVSVDNALEGPKFVFEAAAAGVTSLLGLATGDGSEPDQPHLIWGKLVLIAGLLLLGFRIVRDRGVSRGLAVALALGLAFWLAIALNHDSRRLPTSSRFQYPSAVFLLLIAGEMLRGVRIPRWAIVPAVVVTGLAVSGGISLIEREQSERWAPYADSLRSTLAAVEIAGASADPHFQLAFPPEIEASARAYFLATDQHGSPAFDEGELVERPTGEREGADLTLAQALGLSLVPPGKGDRIIACQQLQASAEGGTGITLLRGGFSFRNETGADVEVMLSRFAPGLPVSLGPLPPGETASLEVPRDNSPRPWNLGLVGEGPVQLCTTESAPA
ncbi:MAG TPA: hypothetical protein VFI03_10095 [Solirubrobacterales bacterium]|nr:hypothetical protein [Solirubrobacterales bacterium]